MRGVGWIGALVALFLLTDVAAAYALVAQLRPERPFELLGALELDAPEDVSSVVLNVEPGRALPAPSLVDSERITMSVTQYPFYPPGDPRHGVLDSVSLPTDATAEPFTATHARLDVVRFTQAPQFVLYDGLRAASMRFNATTVQCMVDDESRFPATSFPDDPDAFRRDKVIRAGRYLLAGDCSVGPVEANTAAWIRVYGMDLHLIADDRDEIIRTGTFDQSDPYVPGTTRRVTQILEIHYAGSDVRFRLEESGRLRFYAQHVAGVGELRVAPSLGTLLWEQQLRDGEIEPFAAQGAFVLEAQPETRVSITGTTLSGPPGLSISGSAFDARSAALAVAFVAGVGVAALLARLAWALFSRLTPDQILAHPRRARILELVRADPGMETNTVARTLGIPWIKAVYHVSHLQRGGYLKVHRVGGRTALFPANAGFRGREMRTALLRRPTQAKIVRALQERPGLDQASLAMLVGVGRSRIAQALAELKLEGLVDAQRAGRRLRYYASDSGSDTATSDSVPVALNC